MLGNEVEKDATNATDGRGEDAIAILDGGRRRDEMREKESIWRRWRRREKAGV